MTETPDITADLLLTAYARGIFPMSESRDDPEIFWVDPRMRGILPLDGFHVSRSLARRIKRGEFEISVNEDFKGVVDACANRTETWISDTIVALYCELHAMGFAHSLEVRVNQDLVGGVYGVTLGAAFFGESMFSTQTDASKIALAYLVHRLCATGFQLFDTQFLTPHLASLGAYEITRAQYHNQLRQALEHDADFTAEVEVPTPQDVIQRNTQTS